MENAITLIVTKMGKLTVMLDDALEKKFREAIGRIKGCHRGSLSEAIAEAIKDWIAKNERNKNEK